MYTTGFQTINSRKGLELEFRVSRSQEFPVESAKSGIYESKASQIKEIIELEKI